MLLKNHLKRARHRSFFFNLNKNIAIKFYIFILKDRNPVNEVFQQNQYACDKCCKRRQERNTDYVSIMPTIWRT